MTSSLQPSQCLGYDLWGFETKANTLRVFIDCSAGVTVEDCERVSRQLSVLLDVEDPAASSYDLEVSSPGLDRPLFKQEQYTGFIGQRLKVKTRTAVDGRRRFTGELLLIDGNKFQLSVDGQTIELGFADIDKANVIAEF